MIFAFGNVYWLFNMSISASVCRYCCSAFKENKKAAEASGTYTMGNSFYQNVDSGGIRSKYSLMTLISKFTTKSVVSV